MSFDWISSPQALVGLLTLVILEIVLGIDNVIFVSILSGRLPEEQRPRARKLWVGIAIITRSLLLLSITWIMGLTKPLFGILNHEFTGRDLVLLVGGGFLIYKSVTEIHHKLEGAQHVETGTVKQVAFGAIMAQIVMMDLIFSFDSVITAIGMVKQVEIMIISVVIALAFMLVFSGRLSAFVEKHPTIKMLALSFLVLIGANLMAEGMGQHIEKAYTYFAMAFATGVEFLNMRLRKKSDSPVQLHETPHLPPGS
ncbi:MAG: TerC family protein [Chthonomonas sp.]|nr:TerC family protein [Chthonomonas sp.]